jgi:hypothetical protein
MNKVLKNSEDWLKEYPGLEVLDPDGWDRSPEGWEKSWNESITRQEFMKRVGVSTIQCPVKLLTEYFK